MSLAFLSNLGYLLLDIDVEEVPVTLRVPAVPQIGYPRDQTLPHHIHTEGQL